LLSLRAACGAACAPGPRRHGRALTNPVPAGARRDRDRPRRAGDGYLRAPWWTSGGVGSCRVASGSEARCGEACRCLGECMHRLGWHRRHARSTARSIRNQCSRHIGYWRRWRARGHGAGTGRRPHRRGAASPEPAAPTRTAARLRGLKRPARARRGSPFAGESSVRMVDTSWIRRGHVWTCLDMSGYVWISCLEMSGHVWTCLDMYGYFWISCLEMSGHVWTCLDTSGYLAGANVQPGSRSARARGLGAHCPGRAGIRYHPTRSPSTLALDSDGQPPEPVTARASHPRPAQSAEGLGPTRKPPRDPGAASPGPGNLNLSPGRDWRPGRRARARPPRTEFRGGTGPRPRAHGRARRAGAQMSRRPTAGLTALTRTRSPPQAVWAPARA
jgi:hypothetical protein